MNGKEKGLLFLSCLGHGVLMTCGLFPIHSLHPFQKSKKKPCYRCADTDDGIANSFPASFFPSCVARVSLMDQQVLYFREAKT